MGREAPIVKLEKLKKLKDVAFASTVGIFLGGIAVAPTTSACSNTRPQLVVVIDTDLFLPRQLAADPSVPRAASFDRVRIHMLNQTGEDLTRLSLRSTLDGDTFLSDIRRDIPIGPDTPWPLTFGVIASEPSGERTVRMRIRMFRSESLASFADISDEPAEALTIDRLAILTVPEDSVETVRILLAGDCTGTVGPSSDSGSSSFETCVTNPRDMRDAHEGIERLPDENHIPPTVAGTWAAARITPCAAVAAPNVGAVCIPGGLSLRGSGTFDESIGDFVASFPEHPVQLSPFFIDRWEVTVRRYRAILARGALSGVSLPIARSDQNPLCTWSADPGDPSFEDRPLNCVGHALATAVCKAEAGDLPTDAQWEHTARHHRSAPYIWGATPATCCSARIGSLLGCGADSSDVGPVNVGSFADQSRCGGASDVSVDGVFDLAGNVRELVHDAPLFYNSSQCPRDPIPRDPRCVVDTLPSMGRGGSFRSTFDQAKIGLRTLALLGADDVGFRCVYRGTGAP